MRIPGGAIGGYLRRTLRFNRLEWLEREVPEDFQQECHLFLLEWARSGGAAAPFPSKEDVRRFGSAAARHFYRVAIAYGYKKNTRRDGSYRRYEERFRDVDEALKFDEAAKMATERR